MEIKRDRLWSEEDEWAALEKRIQNEGLNKNVISTEDKLIHVWRWLVDAENNLQTWRKMLDKLRDQHKQELKEVEYFVETLKDITDGRVAKVEEEKEKILTKLQSLMEISSEDTIKEIAEMLKQEGLEEISFSPISEQVAYLLVERSRLIEEISIVKRKRQGRPTNLTDNVKMNSAQMQQVLEQQQAEFEEELKFQQELAKQVKEQMKKYHEDEMRQIQKNLRQTHNKVDKLDSDSTDIQKETLQIKCQELEGKVAEMDNRLKVMKKAMRELENENENLIYKLSEAMAECDEQEMLLRKMRLNAVMTPSTSQQQLAGSSPMTPVESIKGSQDFVENKILATQQELAWVEQVEKLQDEMKQLEERVLKAGEKYDLLATKYERRKIKEKSHSLKLIDEYQKKMNALKDQMKKLEKEVAICQTILGKEKLHRSRITEDLKTLQEENRKVFEKSLEKDNVIHSNAKELSILKMKLRHLEEANLLLSNELSLFKKRTSKSLPSLASADKPLIQRSISTDHSLTIKEHVLQTKSLSIVRATPEQEQQQPSVTSHVHQIDSGISNPSFGTEFEQTPVTSILSRNGTANVPLTRRRRRFSSSDAENSVLTSLHESPVHLPTWPLSAESLVEK